jgi:hypothetical protein
MIVVALAVALVPAGCGGSGDATPAATTPAAPTPPARTPTAPPAGADGGTSYRIRLPSQPAFEPQAEQVDQGASIRRWQHAVRPQGRSCIVVASEQAGFDGPFPESVISLFDVPQQPGQKNLRNRAIDPTPAGTAGGVEQESTFTGRLADGTTFPAHLYQRAYLTPGKTLIKVGAAGPEDQVQACGLAQVVASLQVTGSEYSAAGSPAPSGSG